MSRYKVLVAVWVMCGNETEAIETVKEDLRLAGYPSAVIDSVSQEL